MAARDGHKDSRFQQPFMSGTGIGAVKHKHGSGPSYTDWQTHQMSVKPLIRTSACHITQKDVSLPEGMSEHGDDFFNSSGRFSVQPIRSQVIIPMAHVVPSTIATTSSNVRICDRAGLPAESDGHGSPYVPQAEPSTIEDNRKFEMPNIEPTMNQSALLNTICTDSRFELPTAAMSRDAEQYKALPESREIRGALTQRDRNPPLNLQCHIWQPDSCSTQPAAENNFWKLKQQYTDNVRLEKLQFVKDYSAASVCATGFHPTVYEWERVVKASDNIIMEKEIMLERQRQHIAVLEQKLRGGVVHSTLLSQSNPYNDMYLIRLQDLQREITFLRAQFADRNDSHSREKAELEKKLCAVESESRGLKEAAQNHSEEMKKQEERVKGRERHINSLKKKCQKEVEENKKVQQKIETLERYMADLPTAEDHQMQVLMDLEERVCQEEATGQAFKEESLQKEAAVQQLKAVVSDLASQNQDLVECNLTIQEQLRLASVRAQPSDVEGSQLFRLYKEMNLCHKNLRSICCLLSQRVQSVDPNLSMLLGVNSTTGLDEQEEYLAFFSVEKCLSEVDKLKRDIEELRTSISDCYAQDMGNNCITQ
ncbi:centrosomal protein of 85 kDa isoform 3-T4 [Anomaloglossus baeobatrachus]|uniref:centrosomal protein of 85 kDa isoform X3 n=1 Tax=Anomaloglossus baeobatrachus TaxID=238106 RepID=UPI003F5006BB